MKIKGEFSYSDSQGRWHEIKGFGILPDDEEMKKLRVSGKMEFENIFCDNMFIEGKCNGETINTKNLSMEGKFKISKIEANEIIIESRSGTIDDIKCATLKIFHYGNREIVGDFGYAKFFGGSLDDKKIIPAVHIKRIVADKIEIENCEVEEIKCNKAVIGGNCFIAKLIVNSEYKVSDKSTVREIIMK